MGDTEPLPEDAMVRALALRACDGTFEAHITIDATETAERERFRVLCRELGVKPVLIELPAGQTPSQPMTAAYHRGSSHAAAQEVAEVARKLRGAGFRIARVKLEAVATNEGIPVTDADAKAFPAGCYFEFHVKLELDGEPVGLAELCDRFSAKLSRNAFKQSADARSERFVTLRMYNVGRQTAFARLDELEAALTAAGYAIVNRQREYSLFDSKVGLDAGWLDAPPVPS